MIIRYKYKIILKYNLKELLLVLLNQSNIPLFLEYGNKHERLYNRTNTGF